MRKHVSENGSVCLDVLPSPTPKQSRTLERADSVFGKELNNPKISSPQFSPHLLNDNAALNHSKETGVSRLQNSPILHSTASTIRSSELTSPKSDVIARLGVGADRGDGLCRFTDDPNLDVDDMPWEGIMTQALLPPLPSSDDDWNL